MLESLKNRYEAAISPILVKTFKDQNLGIYFYLTTAANGLVKKNKAVWFGLNSDLNYIDLLVNMVNNC